ncbi:RsmB/NOP family class I SAM-dependent RNA methyltransferase [Paenibacillus sp. GCM10027626]|uniref:RsmB/NOP family class I SAM-dependent RNA methyltransferase n=1 Tax=Paenibacillus sp. GCM10027626 TaxID=3273411 RepID=UPI0036350691
MGIALPPLFIKKMTKLLGEEYAAFAASYERPRKYGLRVNPLKISAEQFVALSSVKSGLSAIPWADGAYFYQENERPGKHPYYYAGLYYIQEPSAMVPAELLNVQPGDRVLDLCAAPGGKSTQIAAKLQGQGVLVANDNAKERTKALAKNLERAGVRNAVILNEEPERIATAFAGWFDRILVDAPCSGEGMFRKDESMVDQWERHSVERCSLMQRDILSSAVEMLAPGGTLVYSTCTFSPEENEVQIARVLERYSDMRLVPVNSRQHGWSNGRADWVAEAGDITKEHEEISGTVRLWPHLTEGEGHFVAVLRKMGKREEPCLTAACDKPVEADCDSGRLAARLAKARGGKHRNLPKGQESRGRAAVVDAKSSWRQFASERLVGTDMWPGGLVACGSRVYLQPEGLPSLEGLHVVRAGWYLGEAGPHRFEPSQALAMALRIDEVQAALCVHAADERTVRYLKGETLIVDASAIRQHDGQRQLLKGHVLVCIDEYSIGWGKYDGNSLFKNELPAGWRWI